MTATKRTYERLQEALQQCYGTEGYHRVKVLGTIESGMVYTDGVDTFTKLAGNNGAMWFIDILQSYMPKIKSINAKTGDNFFVVTLNVKSDKRGFFKVIQENEEGINVTHIFQELHYTDLQQSSESETEYKFYLIKDYTGNYVLMLTSEY